jgi:hypothetical protein
MNESFTKLDFIIIIVLSLLVAFIIGFNIIQIIDNKLNSVIINVPPQNYTVPSILVNFDKDNKPRKLNSEEINVLNSPSPASSEESMQRENFSELDMEVNTSDSEHKEHFGSLPDKYEHRDDEHMDRFAQNQSSNLGNDIINATREVDNMNVQNPNFNTVDDYPYLIDPADSEQGYYPSRVKLITDKSSPLLKLEEKNLGKINQVLNSCIKNQKPQEINATYDGYNKYPTLQSGSYANFTSIGKSLLTPYVSYPIPS